MTGMKKKNLLTLLLAALMLLTACGGTETESIADQTNPEPGETESVLPGPQLPEMTWDGADFIVYSRRRGEFNYVIKEQTVCPDRCTGRKIRHRDGRDRFH